MADETRKTDVEEVAGHAEYPRIDDTDLKGQLDVGAQALAGQDLTYTKDGMSYQVFLSNKSLLLIWIMNFCIEARKLLRKIDWHIMPLAAWACGLQFVDKSGLGAAATYGLQKDLGLTGNEYSWCVSVSRCGSISRVSL
jgi:MFS transporter, ACS family, allantoate permease